jgi:hypothetical protein
MDENLFRAKLTEVAEWDIPLVSSGGADKKPTDRRRGPKSYEELEWEDNEEDSIGKEIKTGPNDSVPPRILKIKHEPKACEDCDRVVTDRVVEIRIVSNPKPHLREKCNACRKTRNPFTNEFDLEGFSSGNVFKSYALKIERAK